MEGILVVTPYFIALIVGLTMLICPHWVANRIAPHGQKSISHQISFIGMIVTIILLLILALIISSVT